MKSFLFSCALGTLIVLSTARVQAADYTVLPLIVDHDVQPRDSISETLKVSNTTGQPIRLFPTVNEITIGSEGTVEKFIPASMSDNTKSVTSWIEVSRASLEIAPGDTIKVPITIHINPNAQPGEYHGFVGFPAGANRDEAEAKVLKGEAPGTIVRLSLVEKRTEYLRLEHFSVDRFITGTKPAMATYELENVGGLPLTPSGEIIFYDGRGNEQTSLPLNTEQRVIGPGKKETFTMAVPKLGAIGRYKALLNVSYGTNERANLYDTTFFNILPIKWIIGTFVFLLLLSVILVLYYNKRSTRHHSTDDDSVAVYVRGGISAPEKDHDINLKQ